VIEVSLMAPWIFFLFVGTLDFGFYAYALICTENAARVAVAQTSVSLDGALDAALACNYALGEMQALPNMMGVTACDGSGPLTVTVGNPVPTGPDGAPMAQVTVTYHTIQMIPIPGLLANQFWLVRTAEMRVKDTSS
jgi:hypothetical protein